MSWPLLRGLEGRESNVTDTKGVVTADFHLLHTVDSHSTVFVDGLLDVYHI